MSLSAGTRLGPYEIVAPIGAGHEDPRWAELERRVATAGPTK